MKRRYRHFPSVVLYACFYHNRFLLTQKHLISGLPPDRRGDLGERFVSAFTVKRPGLDSKDMALRALSAVTFFNNMATEAEVLTGEVEQQRGKAAKRVGTRGRGRGISSKWDIGC